MSWHLIIMTLINEANKPEISTPVLRYLYTGPGYELQTVSVGHQAKGSEVRGHVLLNRFRGSPLPLDIGCCHTKKAHLRTDVCYTLTPVMQTSHNSSCNIFLTVQDSLLRDKIKTERCHSTSLTWQQRL